jgi:ribose transport system ATP-binding protein
VGRIEVASALEATHISKSFGATRALEAASLAVRRGEIHGLLGENGSGKSTLIKILAGYHSPEPGGRLQVAGHAAKLPLRPGEAAALGLRFVHQDLALIPSLSVVENLCLQELALARRRHISWRRERERASETFARFGVDLDPRARVHELAPAQRAQLAMMRALAAVPPNGFRDEGDRAQPARVLVLDETTSYLEGRERERFLELVRTIAARGVAVLFVSHDLGEVRAVSERVTVLRDGRNAGTARTDAVDAKQLAELVVGERLSPPSAGERTSRRPRPEPSPSRQQASVISLTDLTGGGVRGVSIELAAGEIVGLAGAPGSGYDEIPYMLFGARPCRSGWLTLGRAHDLSAMTPERALRAGIALVPGDRQRDGIVGSLSVEANVTLAMLGRYVRARRLRRRALAQDTSRLLHEYRVRPDDPRIAVEALSGGSQQKVLLAKWIAFEPGLLLLHEPTRGVDVGARREIAATLRELAGRRVAVICASSDHEELAALCDRVLILAGGRLEAELAGTELTGQRIAARGFGLAGPDAALRPARSAER